MFSIKKKLFWPERIIVCKISAIGGSSMKNALPTHTNANTGSHAIEQWTEIHVRSADILEIYKFEINY